MNLVRYVLQLFALQSQTQTTLQPPDLRPAPSQKPMEQAGTLCEQAWLDAMNQCRSILGEDDFKFIKDFENPGQLMSAISELETKYSANGTIPRMLERMVPQLRKLDTFVTVVLLAIGPNNISVACIWGAMSLLIKLASESEKALDEIVTLLSGIHKSLTLFEIYKDSISLDPGYLRTLFDILVDLITCSAFAIRHFRKNDIQLATVVISWNGVSARFAKVLKDIADRAAHLKDIAEAQNIRQLKQGQADSTETIKQLNRTQAELAQCLEGLAMAQSRIQSHSAPDSCHMLPFGRNPGFYGRSEILDRMHSVLHRDDGPSIQSVAIWGMGGIGKTQIALEYASRQIAARVPIVLWISSERETEMLNSFNKAAQKLQLAEFSPTNTPDRNMELVLEHLQKTGSEWILIFDNIVSSEDLMSIRPISGKGQIIVTCRSNFTVEGLVDELIEIPIFSLADGAAFLLKVAGQKSPSADDQKAAEEFSTRLGGLPLALELVGKKIKSKEESVAQFLPYYLRNRQLVNKRPKKGIKNSYYDKDLETVWQGSFEDLSTHAARMLMLLCFVASSEIPEHIFTDGKDLTEKFAFLADEVQFDEAELELKELSLISVNGAESLISIHRLIRDAYFDRMSQEERQEAFSTNVGLLKGPFSRKAGRHLYDRWKLCSRLIQHVQALGERYNELGKTDFFLPSDDLTILITDATWYLQETGNFQAAETLIEIAFSNCVDHDSLAYAYLIDTAATVLDRQGKVPPALPYYLRALEIHLEKSPDGSVEIANAYSAANQGYTGMWQPQDGLNYAMKAIQNSPSDPEEKIKWNPDRYLRNRARTYFTDGQFEKSKADLKEAEGWQTRIHGEDSHYHGETAYMFGRIAASEDNLEEARKQFERAQQLLSKGKPTHASVGAAEFHLGCVSQRQEKFAEALEHLEKALTICQMNEAGKAVPSDSARVKWRLSQVYQSLGREKDAAAYLEAAEHTKNTLLATRDYPQGQGEEREYDSLVGLLYR